MTEPGEDSASDPPAPRGQAYTFFLVVFGTFGLQGLTMVSGILTARILGVEGRGEVALVFALGLLFSQLTFGGSLPVAVAKHVAEAGVAARDGVRPLVRKRAPLLALPCLLAAGMMLFLEWDGSGRHEYALVVCVAVMTFQTMTFRFLVGCLQGELEHLGQMAMVGLIPQAAFSLALTVAFVADWEWDSVAVLAAYFISSVVGLAVGFRVLRTPTRSARDELNERDLWRTTTHSYVSSVRPLDSLGLDRILVGGVLGTVSLGLYSAATALSNLCGMIGNSISVIVLPSVAKFHDDPAAQWAVIRRWSTIAAALSLIIVGILELVAEPLILIAFGDEFEGAIEAARWLILADGLFGLRKVFLAALQGQGKGGTASIIEFAMTPLLVLGIVLGAAGDDLVVVAQAIFGVSALACASFLVVLLRGRRRVAQAA